MRISDWSSDVCSSDLFDDLDACIVAVYDRLVEQLGAELVTAVTAADDDPRSQVRASLDCIVRFVDDDRRRGQVLYVEALGNESLNRRRVQTGHALVSLVERAGTERHGKVRKGRSEEHTSELQSLMRISYAVFCLTNTKPQNQ